MHFYKRWDVDGFAPPDFSNRDAWCAMSALIQHCCRACKPCSLLIVRCRYNLLLFPGAGDGTKPLDYKTVNEHINKGFATIGFNSSEKARRTTLWQIGMIC